MEKVLAVKKRTRHLNIRYYFFTDQIKKGHVKVAFCPTQEMISDFFTKPLQESLFVRMREKILNLPASRVVSIHRSVLEDRKKDTDLVNARRKYVKDDNVEKNKNDKNDENIQDWDTRIAT